MTLRFSRPLALALVALAACTPSIPNQAPPSTVAYAVSFPDTSDGTQSFLPAAPNDLVLQTATQPGQTPTGLGASPAQFAFLQTLSKGGGWPNDQEVPITIQLFAVKVDPNGGNPTPAPFPDLDTATITPSTFAVVKYDGATPTPVDFEVGGYDATKGTLTIRKKVDATTGNRWWAPGRYVAALRAGSNGVKTKAGDPVAAQVSTLLISQDKDLTLEDNQTLLKTLPNPAATAARLEQIRQLYVNPVAWGYTTAAGWAPGQNAQLTTSPFAAIDAVFSHREIASLQTFVVDPNPHVAIDPVGGIVPLPSEFLMDPSYYATPSSTTGPLHSHVAVPTTAPFPAAIIAGLNTLDGFTTTGMLLVPTSGRPIAASTVTGANVVLMRRSRGDQAGAWSKVPDFASNPADPAAGYLLQPPPITVDTATGQPCTAPYAATCASQLIGLQPAVGIPLPSALGGGVRTLPPLDDRTQYAVVVTNGVKDLAGAPLTPGTVSKLVAIAANPATPVAATGTAADLVNGKSQLSGVSDATARQLQALAAVIPAESAALAGAAAVLGVDVSKIVMAYSFPTQSIRTPATFLAGAPWGIAGVTAPPPAFVSGPTAIAPDAAARKYGVPTTPLRNLVGGAFLVKQFVEGTIASADFLDPATGALKNPLAGSAAALPVLIAVPQDVTVPAAGAPLVIFRHGLNGGRAQMMLLAGTFASQGMVVAAIDATKFGDRSWCTTDADCAAGGSCVKTGFGNQGDVAPATPGLCSGALAQNPVKSGLPACSSTVTSECWDGTGGVAKASGSFFVSANLFRTRDSMRQDFYDQNQLVRVLLANFGAAATATMPKLSGTVFYVSQSLGSINGAGTLAASDLAKNTGIPESSIPALGSAMTTASSAVLNVGGGTFVDIAKDSPAFQSILNQLVTGLGITPGTGPYLQFLQVAKWVMDPADPINFVPLLTSKPVLGQAARCDSVVPNTENALYYGLIGLAPLVPTAAAANAKLEWYMADTSTACPADGSTGAGGATHGFLLDFANQSLTLKAQQNAVGFLLTGTPPATTPVLP